MQIKLLDTSLLIAALIGVVLAGRASTERQRLLTEHGRLEEKVGSLPIEDPSKIHVRAVETGEELCFAWRVYFPTEVPFLCETGSGGSYGLAGRMDNYDIVRVRLRENKHGSLTGFFVLSGRSGTFNIANPKLTVLLRERWDEVQIEQLGSDDTVAVIDPHKGAALLRLTVSDDLKREAKQKLGKYVDRVFEPALLVVRFGSKKTRQQSATGKQPTNE